MSRRDDIAQAAMELVAQGGTHALTHHRIDRRLSLPEGTTSNYARTRRDLVLMVAQHIASIAHLRAPEATPPRTIELPPGGAGVYLGQNLDGLLHMLAAVLSGPGVPAFGAFPEPCPTTRHTVVEVLAAGLNPVDLALADGRIPELQAGYPRVAGHEGIGLIGDRRVYFGETRLPYGAMGELTLVVMAASSSGVRLPGRCGGGMR